MVLTKCGFLKKTKKLLDNLQSHSLTSIHNIKHMVFRPFTLQFHIKLKPRFSELIKNAFMCKNEKKRYEYIVVGHNSTYFVKK